MSPDPSSESRLNNILAYYLQAIDAGQAPDRRRLLDDNPDLAESLCTFFAEHDRMRQAATPDLCRLRIAERLLSFPAACCPSSDSVF